MKRKISLFLTFVMFIITTMPSSLLANDVGLYNNNTGRTDSSFTISSSGIANVLVVYEGYPSVTTGATITITVEKRTLLFFWNDVVLETITVSGYRYANNFEYQLEDTGTYRCTIEYVVSGTGGADDVIIFEDKAVYE